MRFQYPTKVAAIGGCPGAIRSKDGILDLPFAMPEELGGNGGATNPKQLFTAGYAACFGSRNSHDAQGSRQGARQRH